MIIIKINILLYFIQIRHTDDFPSTGTRLVYVMSRCNVGHCMSNTALSNTPNEGKSAQMEDMFPCLIPTVVTHTCYKAGPVWYTGSNMM